MHGEPNLRSREALGPRVGGPVVHHRHAPAETHGEPHEWHRVRAGAADEERNRRRHELVHHLHGAVHAEGGAARRERRAEQGETIADGGPLEEREEEGAAGEARRACNG